MDTNNYDVKFATLGLLLHGVVSLGYPQSGEKLDEKNFQLISVAKGVNIYPLKDRACRGWGKIYIRGQSSVTFSKNTNKVVFMEKI